MSSIHFLLVDDEKVLIETIAERLRLKGFIVDCALSGNEALNQLSKSDTIDIVVLDIQMPDLDGMSILEIFKAKHPLVEVIMLTGHATIQSAVEALKFGAYDYLLKPLNKLIVKNANRIVKIGSQATVITYTGDHSLSNTLAKIYIRLVSIMTYAY